MKRRDAINLLGVAPWALSSELSTKNDTLVRILANRWEKSKNYSLEVLEAMPDEDFEFSPSIEQLTFAQHLIHLSFFNNMFLGFMMDDSGFKNMDMLFNAEYLLERPDNINIFNQSKLSKRDGYKKKALVSLYMNDTYNFVLTTLNKIDDGFLSKGLAKDKPEFFGGHSNLDFILRGENHTAHHRAQAIAYLRMKGIEPPGYGVYNIL